MRFSRYRINNAVSSSNIGGRVGDGDALAEDEGLRLKLGDCEKLEELDGDWLKLGESDNDWLELGD